MRKREANARLHLRRTPKEPQPVHTPKCGKHGRRHAPTSRKKAESARSSIPHWTFEGGKEPQIRQEWQLPLQAVPKRQDVRRTQVEDMSQRHSSGDRGAQVHHCDVLCWIISWICRSILAVIQFLPIQPHSQSRGVSWAAARLDRSYASGPAGRRISRPLRCAAAMTRPKSGAGSGAASCSRLVIHSQASAK
jgi:hypothetical protein